MVSVAFLGYKRRNLVFNLSIRTTILQALIDLKNNKMKKIILVLIAFVFASTLKAQRQEFMSKDTSLHCGFAGFAPNGDSIFKSVCIEAEFPGGAMGWRDYLVRNLRTSVSRHINIPKGESSASATVIVSFIVDENGNIDSTAADSFSIATVHKKIVAEAIRAIQEGPKWKPASICDKKVPYRARQQITFVNSKD